MYRIEVIKQDGAYNLDLTKLSFPFNIESNDVAQLNDSSASWSYTISLPRTANNERVLGSAGVPYVDSVTPYRRVTVNVYAEGVRVIHNGVMFIDTTTRTEYKVQILAGNANVFELMKAVDFKNWNQANVVTLPTTSQPTPNSLSGDVAYAYPLNLYVTLQNALKIQTKEDDFYMYATPLLRVGSPSNAGLLKRLMDGIGYTLVTDTSNVTLNRLRLSLVTRKKASGSNSYMWQSAMSNIGTGNIITNAGKSRRGKTRFYCEFTSQNDFYNTHHSQVSLASAFASFQSAGGSCYLVYFDQNGTEIARSSTNEFTVSGNKLVASKEVDGSVAYVSFYSYGGVSDTEWTGYDGSGYYTYTGMHIISSQWRVQTIPAEDSDNAVSGQKVNLEANCGIANGMDFFKILSQIFGWTVKVDADTKTIYARTFSYITGNKASAKDWTDKVAKDQPLEADFDFGSYARENIIKFAENKAGGYTDTASFTIDNDNLAASKTLLDIKVSSGRDAHAEQWEKKDDGNYEWKDGSAPHFISWQPAGLVHLMPADVLANYSALVNSLQHVVVLKVKMLLNAVDILNFDQFVPVYLRQFGRYYYVNKISNWESGKLCDVELLQLTF